MNRPAGRHRQVSEHAQPGQPAAVGAGGCLLVDDLPACPERGKAAGFRQQWGHPAIVVVLADRSHARLLKVREPGNLQLVEHGDRPPLQ